MKEIILTQGKVALVDNEDYDLVMQYKWYMEKHGNNTYFARESRQGPYMHTLILKHHSLWIPKYYTIHKDENGLNNMNLNLVMVKGIRRESKVIMSNNKSGYRGVTLHRNRWRVQICKNGVNQTKGYFIDKHEAARTYNKWSREYFGDNGFQNIIKGNESC